MFDMTQCKNGDKLVTRGGKTRWYIGFNPLSKKHIVSLENTHLTERHSDGNIDTDSPHPLDIVSFAPKKMIVWGVLLLKGDIISNPTSLTRVCEEGIKPDYSMYDHKQNVTVTEPVIMHTYTEEGR